MNVRIDATQLEALIAEIFERVGCMRDEAERIAMRLLGANLTGHDSHGVLRTSRYVDWVERGLFHPGRKVHIGFDSDALCILDGQYGFGQTIGEQAVRLGLGKAAKSGAVAGVDAQRVEARGLIAGEYRLQVVGEVSHRAQLDLGEAALGLEVVGAGDLAENVVGQERCGFDPQRVETGPGVEILAL